MHNIKRMIIAKDMPSQKTDMMTQNNHPVILIHFPMGKRCCFATLFLFTVPLARVMASHHRKITFYPKGLHGASVNSK